MAAAEAGVGQEHHLHPRPLGQQRPHQQGQDGTRPARRIPVARLKSRRQQRNAAVGGDLRTRELGLDKAPFGGCETSDVEVTLRYGGCPREMELNTLTIKGIPPSFN